MKRNFYLIDTNVIIRFLTKDNEILSERSAEIFDKIESGEIKAKITDGVLAEIVYVIMKIYKKDRKFITGTLRKILNLRGIINHDKVQLKKALDIFEERKIDIVDAILLARSEQCLGVLSFDRDLNR